MNPDPNGSGSTLLYSASFYLFLMAWIVFGMCKNDILLSAPDADRKFNPTVAFVQFNPRGNS